MKVYRQERLTDYTESNLIGYFSANLNIQKILRIDLCNLNCWRWNADMYK